MINQHATLYQDLAAYLEARRGELAEISNERKAILQQLARYIIAQRQTSGEVALNFICTHNSRRSHLSQLAMAAALAYFGIDGVSTWSGGTEVTTFHPNAIAALKRAGFAIEQTGGNNPHYRVTYQVSGPVLTCFSKTYDDPTNPQQGFAAIMTCSDADEHCPLIPRANFRLPLTYEDPKMADGTPAETAKYDATLRQISRELLLVCSIIDNQSITR